MDGGGGFWSSLGIFTGFLWFALALWLPRQLTNDQNGQVWLAILLMAIGALLGALIGR